MKIVNEHHKLTVREEGPGPEDGGDLPDGRDRRVSSVACSAEADTAGVRGCAPRHPDLWHGEPY